MVMTRELLAFSMARIACARLSENHRPHQQRLESHHRQQDPEQSREVE